MNYQIIVNGVAAVQSESSSFLLKAIISKSSPGVGGCHLGDILGRIWGLARIRGKREPYAMGLLVVVSTEYIVSDCEAFSAKPGQKLAEKPVSSL